MAQKPKLKPKQKKPRKLPPEKRPLTGKQRLFVTYYVSDVCNCNGTEAARRAGYSGSYGTLAVVAHENLKKPNVRAAIDAALAAAGSDAGVTVESTLRKLSQIRERAIEDAKWSAAAQCTIAQGRYLKMFTDKIEHVANIDEMSTDDLLRLFNQLQEESGIDISRLIAGPGQSDSDVPGAPGDTTTH